MRKEKQDVRFFKQKFQPCLEGAVNFARSFLNPVFETLGFCNDKFQAWYKIITRYIPCRTTAIKGVNKELLSKFASIINKLTFIPPGIEINLFKFT